MILSHNRSDVGFKNERNFGFVFGTLFFLFSIYAVVKVSDYWAIISLFISLLLVFMAIASPHMLKTPNALWNKIGFLMAKVTNPLMLAIVFFGILTPVAYILRLFGRDELRLNKSKWKNVSNWITREKIDLNLNFFKKPY